MDVAEGRETDARARLVPVIAYLDRSGVCEPVVARVLALAGGRAQDPELRATLLGRARAQYEAMGDEAQIAALDDEIASRPPRS